MLRSLQKLLSRAPRQVPGLAAVLVSASRVSFARIEWGGDETGAARPRLVALKLLPRAGDPAALLQDLAREQSLARLPCVTLLPPGDYQTLQVDAPTVAPEELGEALRWRIKDSLPFALEQAVVEHVLLPQGMGMSARPPQVLVVAADKAVVQRHAAPLLSAGLTLSAVDIPELAQRNVAALCEDDNRGLAFLHLGEDGGLLTLTFQGELFASRRMETGGLDAGEGGFVLERVALELQRSLDYFDRQFSFISVSRLVIAGGREVSPLVAALGQTLYLPVERLDWARILDLPEGCGEVPGEALPVIGAALRHEGASP